MIYLLIACGITAMAGLAVAWIAFAARTVAEWREMEEREEDR